MSGITPPGGPGRPSGIETPAPATGAGGASGPRGPSFSERVAERQGAAEANATHAAPSQAASSQAVIADLRAGRIGPDEAVRRLTDIAIERSGAPAARRPVLEARVREMMASDPLVQDLLRRMGASLPSDE